jgi:NADH-quinone oxidoreductase subunit G
VQSFNQVVKNQGESRPGWKVLRMLGALMELRGFQAERLEDVRASIAPDLAAWALAGLGNELADFEWQVQPVPQGLQRVAEFPIYGSDPVVRRSGPLQKTQDGRLSRAVRMNAALAASLGVAAGGEVLVRAASAEARLPVAIDEGLAPDCVRIARGIAETAMLAAGPVTLERVREAAVA